MSELELRLATLKYLLSKVDSYKELINKKDYQKLNTGEYNKKLRNFCSVIEGEITDISDDLKNKGVTHPKENFTGREVNSFVKNDPVIQSLFEKKGTIYMDICRESNDIEIDFMTQFDIDFSPEWIFPTSTASINNDINIIESSSKNTLSVDDLFINEIMTHERINETLSHWKEKPNIDGRINILEQAIEAHIEGKFYLSVSTLIPQIEGLLREALKAMSRPDNFLSMQLEERNRALNALKELWILQDYTFKKTSCLVDRLFDALNDLYEDNNPSESIPISNKLSRHGVCHGFQTDFGTEKNSLRLILLLDRIIFFYTQ